MYNMRTMYIISVTVNLDKKITKMREDPIFSAVIYRQEREGMSVVTFDRMDMMRYQEVDLLHSSFQYVTRG